jgi:hypothetical protein
MIGALSAAAALLLVCSGAAKLRAPAPAGRTIGALLPAVRRARPGVLAWLARSVGAGEVAVGGAVLALGGRGPAAALAAGYLIFAVVAVRLRTAGVGVPCGCFGRSDAPVGVQHIVLNAVCAGVAAAAAAQPVGAAGGLLQHGAFVAAIGLMQVALLAWLGYLAITALPALTALAREA